MSRWHAVSLGCRGHMMFRNCTRTSHCDNCPPFSRRICSGGLGRTQQRRRPRQVGSFGRWRCDIATILWTLLAPGWTTNREQMHAIEREGKTDASSRNANCLAEREPEADIAGICDCSCRLQAANNPGSPDLNGWQNIEHDITAAGGIRSSVSSGTLAFSASSRQHGNVEPRAGRRHADQFLVRQSLDPRRPDAALAPLCFDVCLLCDRTYTPLGKEQSRSLSWICTTHPSTPSRDGCS